MDEMNALIEKWKKQLLDLSKQNRLIHFRETKRGSLRIVSPDLDIIYKQLVEQRQPLVFERNQKEEGPVEKSRPEKSTKLPFDLQQAITIAKEVATKVTEEKEKYPSIVSNRTDTEERHILKILKDKAKTVMEEQGVHTLYLAFGFLKWREQGNDSSYYSPLVLVPVTVKQDSIHGPFELEYYEEEIIVNPTLLWKLEKEYGITVPEYDPANVEILDYLSEVETFAAKYEWEVEIECSLSLFTYAKMKMYQDIIEHEDVIRNHPILKAFAGDLSEIQSLPQEFNNYNHDVNSKPSETFQVLDADSSQQDAILYSNKGISFVLQGPPGTGKSQTIANIIAEAMASDKKVLFVSEKMAALEVVYKRLSEVGLADFCLPLHSYKANKKEVLDEINQTLHMEKVKLYEEVLCQLDMLQEHRKRLNQYALELHTVCEPLHQSIYEVNGRLSKLYLCPNMEFHLNEVEKTTGDELHQYIYLVSEYQKILEKFSGTLEEHPWYGSNLDESGYERKAEITTHTGQLKNKLTQLLEAMDGIMQEYGLQVQSTYQGAYDLIQILKTARRAPKMEKHFLSNSNLKEAIEIARQHEIMQKEFYQIKTLLDQMFQVNYEEIDAEEGVHLLSESMEEARELLNGRVFTTNNDVMLSMPNLLPILEQERTILQHAMDAAAKVEKKLGLGAADTIQEINHVIVQLELLALNPRPTIQWFDFAKWKSNYNKLMEIKEAMLLLEERAEDITQSYSIDIVTINAEEMLYRFDHEYRTVYKKLKKEYRRDVELIRSFAKREYEKVEDEEIVRLLRKIIIYQENFVWIKERADWLKRFLGVHYQEQHINWPVVEKELVNFKRILDYYGEEQIPDSVKELLLEGDCVSEDAKQAYFALQSLTFRENIERIESIFKLTVPVGQISLKELEEKITSLYGHLSLIDQIVALMNIPSNTNMPYSEGLSVLKKLRRYQQIEEETRKQQTELKRLYASLYQGFDTDWNKIIIKLTWLNEMRTFSTENEISREFIESCMNHTVTELVKETLEYMIWCVSEAVEEFRWFSNLFYEPEENAFEKLDLATLIQRLDQILEEDSLLDQWCNYARAKAALVEAGLEEFVVEAEEMSMNVSILTDTFIKRFYQLWLDKMAPNFETVANFQSDMLEDTRNDFDKLDVTQFAIAKARIRERLLANLPDIDTSFSGEDEVGIFKRELAQKHKLPLRKLFEKIPNLLLSLKPCFMMSPLSVSLFLQQEKFKFDLVIFDEASQVRTEDAVGAILRGAQVIIAGDCEQLPPTSFFTAASGAEEAVEVNEEGRKTGADSILEEAQMILPERTLRWHYRSRHESLIAFSNAKIYNHNLITFPSTVEQMSHSGVEYYYVEDGIYDRGGKKNNTVEAKKVVEMILEQIKERPDRSLGVITFSEAQQQEVERQLQEVRLQNPEYEEFFAETKPEPFFIKNLENVQGDERDTIIFSIGYGKDENGVFSMNFGPLSRNGGYRRLNVAITRAKYNIKLVGSFLPEEMRVENSSSEGVMMLYSYLQYAINRNDFMKKDETIREEAKFTAPFEESIHEYLVSHNYKVETKIGCSGYRIDLAVAHPTLEGHYVLGIECDGATYHAARTVRERERLRQTVLKDMGWNIYRIWSTDWIKNPFIEGQKLLEVIEQAINEYKVEEKI